MLPFYLLQTICSTYGTGTGMGNFINSVIVPIVGTSLATMVVMLALMYVAANFFKKSEYESFVSIELYQLLVSALLFVTIFGATIFTEQASCDISGNSPFIIAQQYLNTMTNQVALPYLVKLEKAKMWAQYWGSLSFRWGLAVWGTTIPAIPSYVIVERAIDFLLMTLTPFVSSLMVQQVGLEIIQATAIPFVLPAGVVLRIFPPTREAGSFLIACAVGFGIIFPYTYVMHDQITSMLLSNNTDNQDIAYFLANNPGYQDVSFTLSPTSDVDLTSWSYNPYTVLISPLYGLSFLLLAAVFLPSLSITLTVAFIRGFLKFISQKLD
jgi:hypothetical protein